LTAELSRREFISNVGAMAAGGLAVHSLAAQAAPGTTSGGTPLRDRAASRGLLYGAATQRSILKGDLTFAAAFAQQCGVLVPENELQWSVIRPTPDTFDFSRPDWLYNFTQQHQMKFRGTSIAWNQALPAWFNSYVNSTNAKQLLLTHIATVVGHYSGKMHSWDVVNEVIQPNDKRADGLCLKPWLELIGPDYIDMAFHASAEADPHAILVWNENHLEFNDAWSQAKRDFLVGLLKDKLKRGVPIHAVGLQSHLSGTTTDFNGAAFTLFLRTIADLGVKIMITEMDVTDADLPADVSLRDQGVAKVYYGYLSTVLNEKAVVAVLTWGLSDHFTFISHYKPRKDGAPVRPLPLDYGMNPTPAWDAIARAFDEMPAR
jgi:endo-1,4-beta-xylanase